MKFKVDKQERYVIFTLEDENLNSLISPSLKSELVILASEGIPNLILDLSNVKYIDSSGLSAILVANRLWKTLGSFVLTGLVSPSTKTLVTIARLDSIVNVIETVQESIDFIFMEELERELNKDPETNNDKTNPSSP